MKRILFVMSCCAAALSVSAAVVKEYQRTDGDVNAPLPGTVIYSDMFSDGSLWREPGKDSNYRNLLTIKREGGALSVIGTKSDKTKDTGWNVMTKPLPLTVKGLGYVLSYGIETKPRIRNSGGSSCYSSAVLWYDHAGNLIARDPFMLRTSGEDRRRAVMVGSVPAAAESFAVQFGFDRPNLVGDDFLRLDSLAFSVMPHETDQAWMHKPEPEAPRIKVVSETPFTDPQAELKISVTSSRPIDWSALKILLDGKDATAEFTRDGAILSYRPGGKWGKCIHTAKIISGPEKDVLGNESISMLMKRYRGETYLIAVNGTLSEVKAEFDLGVRPAKAEVLWENRSVPVSGGKITDVFAPFAVHVYRVEDPISYIAHQGEEALAPSHSKPAYRLAAEHKLDYLKLDLRETKDGHVVLQHDGTLKAMMKWDVKISDHTLAEIRERGRYLPRRGYTNETIVTLPEALEIAKGMKKGVWFDFKHFTPAFAEKVFRIADEAGYTSDRIIVATFTKPALKWVQKNRPDVRRVAHTFIRKVKGGFQMNAGDEHKVYPSVDAVAEGLERHARDYGLYGFNVPHIYRAGRQLYNTPASLVKRLHDAGYWISIWFAYDAGTGEYYREAGADAFVTNWKDRTFPEYFPEKEKWAALMRFMARTELEIKDAGSKRRNEALYFCTWEPELAADAILKSGKWPLDCKGVIDILENASWTMPEDRDPR